MTSAIADSGTVQALTSLAMAPKQRLNLLHAGSAQTIVQRIRVAGGSRLWSKKFLSCTVQIYILKLKNASH